MICRSVGMDAWSQDQLKKMQLGGNEKMNDFFSKYGVSKITDIKEKYNSTAAEVGSRPRGKNLGRNVRKARKAHENNSCLNFSFTSSMPSLSGQRMSQGPQQIGF